MSEVEIFRAGPSRGVARQVSRTLSHIEGATAVGIARADARADLEAAKVNAAVAVTQHALAGAQYLTNLEMALAEQTPAAMLRLKQIGDVGSLALAQIVMDTATKLRRI